ncbi:heme-binding HmuY-like protein [Roseivirga pacifica]|uniref:HmuY protein n=1 Tax=Roseivirga pacifica TaxID=1267423 RepID=A0A1I0RNK3_9BACT|nr:HmuY family protein [Roseivirga pacifica]RKQ49934.1 heme-binding HmuY-like protein [Roseivirga pacifica]SEW42787.1 HmuY protein [Roseivirga pacifica]
MITKSTLKLWAAVAVLGFASACSDDDGPIEEPAAAGAVVAPAVGGPDQPNQVFVDLSAEETYVVERNGWDLGFYSGSEYRVIINNPTSAFARAIDKTDLTTVTAEDTVGMGAQLDINAIFGTLFGPQVPEWVSEATTWMDAPNGDISQTAIAAVSATESQNQVYILNRGNNPDGSNRGWVKLRVLQNGNGYTLRYAEIASETYQEINISKDTEYDFVSIDLDNGAEVSFPKKNNWDIMFSVWTNVIPFSATTSIPYSYKDFVISNTARVEVAVVEVAGDVTYDSFDFTGVGSLTFTNDYDAIGSGWRTTSSPGSDQGPGVVDTQFYVIKDTGDNYYKLKFTRLVDPVSGERGNAQFQYDLLVQ